MSESWTGYVTATSGLRVRSEAHTNSQVITMLPYGSEVSVIGATGDWYQLGNGFVFAEYVSRDKPTIQPIIDEPPASVVTDFDRAIAFVLRWEGGLSEDKNDPGGLTNFGISQRAYPKLDIRNLTREQAVDIYHRDYWQASGADALPWPLNLLHFDAAVNTGVPQAKAFLAASGGNMTKYAAIRLEFYTRIAGWPHYGAAWTRRVADLLKEAA